MAAIAATHARVDAGPHRMTSVHEPAPREPSYTPQTLLEMAPVEDDVAPIRILVWNEFIQEREDPPVKEIYPDGIHTVIADGLRRSLGPGAEVRTATLDQPEQGLSAEALAQTDVMLWWSHEAQDLLDDAIAERVRTRVLEGMGFLALHSAHISKVFRLLMGTSCRLTWRVIDDTEFIWTVSPSHPITEGLPHPIVVPKQEMYGEFFDIPSPDELVFVSSFSKSVEVFRSGCTFRRGLGRIFYFSPGHEIYPVYHQPEIQQVLANAVRWAYQPQVSQIEIVTKGNTPKPLLRVRE